MYENPSIFRSTIENGVFYVSGHVMLSNVMFLYRDIDRIHRFIDEKRESIIFNMKYVERFDNAIVSLICLIKDRIKNVRFVEMSDELLEVLKVQKIDI